MDAKMSRLKSLCLSVAIGLVLTGVLTAIGLNLDKGKVASILLWQYAIPAWLVYPGGPLLYVDDHNTPHYEGSPMLLLILPVGFLLGIFFYAVPSYFVIRWFVGHRENDVAAIARGSD